VGNDLLCIKNTNNFTEGKKYVLLGLGIKGTLNIRGDNGKKTFPPAICFKQITLFMRLKKLVYGRY